MVVLVDNLFAKIIIILNVSIFLNNFKTPSCFFFSSCILDGLARISFADCSDFSSELSGTSSEVFLEFSSRWSGDRSGIIYKPFPLVSLTGASAGPFGDASLRARGVTMTSESLDYDSHGSEPALLCTPELTFRALRGDGVQARLY